MCRVVLAYGLCVSLAVQSISYAKDVCLVDQTIDPDAKFLFVYVTFKGKELKFVLDTGASAHVFGSHLTPLIDGEITEELNFSVCGAQDLRVQGTSDSVRRKGLIKDLTELSSALGCRIDGILGMPFLENRVLVLDFDRQQLKIESVRNVQEGNKFEILYDDFARPYLADATLAHLPVVLLIDTGATHPITIQPELFECCSAIHGIENVQESTQITINGNRKTKLGIARELTLGQIICTRVPVSESDSDCIGISFLQRFHVTMDFACHKLILSPRANPEAPKRLSDNPGSAECEIRAGQM